VGASYEAGLPLQGTTYGQKGPGWGGHCAGIVPRELTQAAGFVRWDQLTWDAAEWTLFALAEGDDDLVGAGTASGLGVSRDGPENGERIGRAGPWGARRRATLHAREPPQQTARETAESAGQALVALHCMDGEPETPHP
jgi:hypothetical protein